ncbi:pyrroline-5-carboxylate reductase [Bacillus massiliglaciei]|uniref:pyrroline-5-carboxylate reductase n=1 Tax=Bacillus massiliglaciei TaxID=1816693 RepID=UPI000B31E004|nr:pyrroline-5-carboxylate reductase [Bacillus massiliglaciei]
MLKNKTVIFLGAGSMAESMISGIINAQKLPAEQIHVTNATNHERLGEIKERYGVRTFPKNEIPYQEADLIILAMKPKGAEGILREIKDNLSPEQTVISVLAGISIDFMEKRLKQGQQVVRIMPNTSSSVRESATALSPGSAVQKDHIETVRELFECMGKVFLINEKEMDVFTGIAGSGPAYFYYLMEQMERAGKAAGLEDEAVRKIVAQTLYGAAKMVLETGEDPAVLRKNVTSPNGTTASGLEALEKYRGGEAITQAIYYAAERSKEISQELDSSLVES